MSAETDALRTLAGVDASRRVGWARYFDEVERNERLAETTLASITQAVALSLLVQHHERLAHNDPLVEFAADFLNDVGATPSGHRLIESIKAHLF